MNSNTLQQPSALTENSFFAFSAEDYKLKAIEPIFDDGLTQLHLNLAPVWRTAQELPAALTSQPHRMVHLVRNAS